MERCWDGGSVACWAAASPAYRESPHDCSDTKSLNPLLDCYGVCAHLMGLGTCFCHTMAWNLLFAGSAWLSGQLQVVWGFRPIFVIVCAVYSISIALQYKLFAPLEHHEI